MKNRSVFSVNKSSFVVYKEWRKPISSLSESQKAQILDAIFEYQDGEEITSTDPIVLMAFSFFKMRFDADKAAYEDKCVKNKENGTKGGRPKKTEENPNKPEETKNNPKKANGFSNNRSEPKKADNDNDFDNDLLNTPLTPQRGRNAYSEDFELFWEAYPNKANKLAAYKAWCKLKKSGVLPELSLLQERLENKKHGREWTKENGQYIPHPASWLNAGGWEDADAITLNVSRPSDPYEGLLPLN